MNYKIKIVSFLGAIAVILGAFAAHGLKPILEPQQLETFKTGTLYHFFHLIPMLIITILSKENKILNTSFYLFLSGIIFFSGSLYLLATKTLIGGDVWNFLGPITPIGGILFILGWINVSRYEG